MAEKKDKILYKPESKSEKAREAKKNRDRRSIAIIAAIVVFAVAGFFAYSRIADSGAQPKPTSSIYDPEYIAIRIKTDTEYNRYKKMIDEFNRGEGGLTEQQYNSLHEVCSRYEYEKRSRGETIAASAPAVTEEPVTAERPPEEQVTDPAE